MDIKITLPDKLGNGLLWLHARRRMLLLLTLWLGSTGLLVYAAVVTKPYLFKDGEVVSAAQINATFDTLYTEINNKETRLNTLETASWTKGTGGLYTNETRVGIGVTSPAARLEVKGGVKVDNDSSTCNSSMAGTLRWNGTNFQGCNGTTWVQLDNATRSGQSIQDPAIDCKTLLADYPSSTSGLYYIDPDGTSGPNAAFQVYCDMATNGGGWTKILQYGGGVSLATSSAVGSTTAWMTGETTGGKLSDAQINQISSTEYLIYTADTSYAGMRWGAFKPTSAFTWQSTSSTYNMITTWAATKCWNNATLTLSTPDAWSVCGSLAGPIGFCTHKSGSWAVCLCGNGVQENVHPCQSAGAGYTVSKHGVYKR